MTRPFTRPCLSADAEEVVAELAVLRALEAAGKRARLPRACMATAKSVPSHTVHTAVALVACPADCDRLLAGVWDHLQLVLPEHAEELARACDGYVRDLIVRQQPHQRPALRRWLAEYRGR